MRPGSDNLHMPNECLDAATSRLLMKKTWCHGQVIAAFQGIFYAYWGYESTEVPKSSRILLACSAVVLPVWTLTSWFAMHGRSSSCGWMILGFGSILLLLYLSVFAIALQASGDPLQLAAIIVTGLQLVETSAYLTVVACLKEALVQDAGQDQYDLM